MIIAILVLLWAILFAALGPVREKGRQAVCLSNLRQIGQAIQMYRQDYGGKEPEGGAAYYELGLPPSLTDLPLYRKEPRVCKCPDENYHEKMMCSYFYGAWDDRIHGIGGPAPPFSQLIAEKGDEYPLVYDFWHDPDWGNARKPHLVLVLRLGGRVHTKVVPPATPSWDY
jgi:hypothetical protein